MNFAQRLSSLMEQNETTNYRLAKSIGCSPTTITNWLEGKEITQGLLGKVADFFNVSVDYLLGKTDIKKPRKQSSLRGFFFSIHTP